MCENQEEYIHSKLCFYGIYAIYIALQEKNKLIEPQKSKNDVCYIFKNGSKLDIFSTGIGHKIL